MATPPIKKSILNYKIFFNIWLYLSLLLSTTVFASSLEFGEVGSSGTFSIKLVVTTTYATLNEKVPGATTWKVGMFGSSAPGSTTTLTRAEGIYPRT